MSANLIKAKIIELGLTNEIVAEQLTKRGVTCNPNMLSKAIHGKYGNRTEEIRDAAYDFLNEYRREGKLL